MRLVPWVAPEVFYRESHPVVSFWHICLGGLVLWMVLRRSLILFWGQGVTASFFQTLQPYVRDGDWQQALVFVRGYPRLSLARLLGDGLEAAPLGMEGVQGALRAAMLEQHIRHSRGVDRLRGIAYLATAVAGLDFVTLLQHTQSQFHLTIITREMQRVHMASVITECLSLLVPALSIVLLCWISHAIFIRRVHHLSVELSTSAEWLCQELQQRAQPVCQEARPSSQESPDGNTAERTTMRTMISRSKRGLGEAFRCGAILSPFGVTLLTLALVSLYVLERWDWPLVTSRHGPDVKILLPHSSASVEPFYREGQLTIMPQAIWLEKEPVTLEPGDNEGSPGLRSLRSALAAHLAFLLDIERRGGRPFTGTLLLYVDARVPYGQLDRVLEECRSARFNWFSLVVIQD